MSESGSRRPGKQTKSFAAAVSFAAAFAIFCACRIPSTTRVENDAPAYIVVDSEEFTVRYERPAYRTVIGYTYINKSGRTVSANYCAKPRPPALESEVAPGRWVVAYSTIELTCLTLHRSASRRERRIAASSRCSA